MITKLADFLAEKAKKTTAPAVNENEGTPVVETPAAPVAEVPVETPVATPTETPVAEVPVTTPGAETNEFFGMGNKVINLATYQGSKDAVAFVTQRKDLMKNYYAYFMKDGAMDQPTADKAVMALYDFAKGIPLLNKYALTYNAPNLTINPNKDGILKALVSGASGNTAMS
jgi:hypothetical protein